MIWTRMMIRAVVLMIQKVRGIVKFIWLSRYVVPVVKKNQKAWFLVEK